MIWHAINWDKRHGTLDTASPHFAGLVLSWWPHPGTCKLIHLIRHFSVWVERTWPLLPAPLPWPATEAVSLTVWLSSLSGCRPHLPFYCDFTQGCADFGLSYHFCYWHNLTGKSARLLGFLSSSVTNSHSALPSVWIPVQWFRQVPANGLFIPLLSCSSPHFRL